MPEKQSTTADPLVGGSFSHFLFSDDTEVEDAVTVMGLDHQNIDVSGGDNCFTFSDDRRPPRMLCFGGEYVKNNQINSATADSTTTDSNTANSSSPSSTNNSTTTSLSSNSNRKRNARCDIYQPVVLQDGIIAAPVKVTQQRNSKKTRAENTPPAGHAKVKKEKLGERIAALQQIVSPYGKTDTASVLHEAMGYIRFLHEQVEVLCSPYLGQPPPSFSSAQDVQQLGKENGGEMKKDLRSRGLCLVPVECTLHVAESNGADFWSPAMASSHCSSSQR